MPIFGTFHLNKLILRAFCREIPTYSFMTRRCFKNVVRYGTLNCEAAIFGPPEMSMHTPQEQR